MAKTQSTVEIDDYNLEEALRLVSKFGTDRFGYIVTPNVDHVLRHYYEPTFRDLYAHASYVLLDSRFLARTVGLFKRQVLRVCLGSDLTTSILRSVIQPMDVAVLVGSTPAQAQFLRQRFGLRALHHIAPPMNLLRDPAAVESCLEQIEAIGKFRFCFLAVGSPQQELIAQKLKARGRVRGLALCIGASIDFLTGIERRAPVWMQEASLEWLHRLIQNPRRLWKRYLVRGPRIFLLLSQIELKVRRTANTPAVREEAVMPGGAAPSAVTVVASSARLV